MAFLSQFYPPDGRQGSPQGYAPAQKIFLDQLSHRGLIETTDVILLEQILYEREEREMRNPELYHVMATENRDMNGLTCALLPNGRIFQYP